MTEILQHIHRPLTDAERQQAEFVRQGAMQDFPPKPVSPLTPPPGIPSQIYDARTHQGLTRYELAHTAQVPATVVRAIEQGEDVPLSQLTAVAAALHLTLELVEQTAGA